MSAPRKYTDEHDAYIAEHYHEMYAEEIAKAIGAPDANAVRGYARRLAARGVAFKYKKGDLDRSAVLYANVVKPQKKIDYEDVPWQMRITNRNQGVPEMSYNTLGPRGLDNDDPEMLALLKR